MAKRILWRHQATDVVLPGGGALTIGRAPDADIRIDDPMVSHQHARLVIDSHGVTIEDTGSRNGVFVGDKRIAAPHRLSDGDWIRIGRSEHSVRIESVIGGGRVQSTTMELRVMSAEDILAASEFQKTETRADVSAMRPIDLIRESGRRWLAEQGLPLLERFSSALYLVEILSAVEASTEAQSLLGEAIDQLGRARAEGVLAPSLATRARGHVTRWFPQEVTQAWQDRLGVLARAEGTGDRASVPPSGATGRVLQSELRAALGRGDIKPHYQPIFDLRHGRAVATEALARWQHAERGWIPPATFIPVAEHAGLIQALGDQILRAACQQTQEWRSRLPDLRVCVNLSSRQFLQADLVAQVERALADTGLPPQALELELTESMLMQNPQMAGAMMLHLRALGIRLAIDDFGTGYSSLSYLHRFPLNVLKIDRSFVEDLDEDGEGSAIVRTIVTLAHGLGLEAIAEGVENAAQRDRLQSFNCDLGQGYFFARPAAADVILPVLLRGIDPRG